MVSALVLLNVTRNKINDVAGKLAEMMLRMVPGSDLEFRGSANSPSLLIDSVAIAGK